MLRQAPLKPVQSAIATARKGLSDIFPTVTPDWLPEALIIRSRYFCNGVRSPPTVPAEYVCQTLEKLAAGMRLNRRLLNLHPVDQTGIRSPERGSVDIAKFRFAADLSETYVKGLTDTQLDTFFLSSRRTWTIRHRNPFHFSQTVTMQRVSSRGYQMGHDRGKQPEIKPYLRSNPVGQQESAGLLKCTPVSASV